MSFKKVKVRFILCLVLSLIFYMYLPKMLNAQNKTSPYKTIKIGKIERTYLIRVPKSLDENKPVPLVIVLHGAQDNALNAEQESGMSTKGSINKFIVVYPNGTGIRNFEGTRTWNVGNCCGPALDLKVDDVGFIRNLISEIEKNYNIDQNKIYVMGTSNGGMLAYLLACELSEKIAAIADISGVMPNNNSKPAEPVSVLIIHGTADQIIRYEGGAPFQNRDWHKRIDNPTSYAVLFWAQNNRCNLTPTREQIGNTIKETYKNCKNGTEVILYTIIGGGHSMPAQINQNAPSDTIWNFFNSHPKKKSNNVLFHKPNF